MLGFHVSNQEIGVIAAWAGSLETDEWLQDAVKRGDAKKVSTSEKSPFVYSVKASAIPKDKIGSLILDPEETVVVEMWD